MSYTPTMSSMSEREEQLDCDLTVKRCEIRIAGDPPGVSQYVTEKMFAAGIDGKILELELKGDFRIVGNKTTLSHMEIFNPNGHKLIFDGVMDGMFENSAYTGSLPGICTKDVTSMKRLFKNSRFNGDISGWDVSNVWDFTECFMESRFNGDISKWIMKLAILVVSMFENSRFNGDISNWDLSNVVDMCCMFMNSEHKGVISGWDVGKVKYAYRAFYGSEIEDTECFIRWNMESAVDISRMFDDAPVDGEAIIKAWRDAGYNCGIDQ